MVETFTYTSDYGSFTASGRPGELSRIVHYLENTQRGKQDLSTMINSLNANDPAPNWNDVSVVGIVIAWFSIFKSGRFR